MSRVLSSPVALRQPTGQTGVHGVLLGLLVFGSALDAYSVGSIPLEWLVQIVTIGAGIIVAVRWATRWPRGFGFLLLLLLWALVVTGLRLVTDDYSLLLPPLATTPYLVFVGLRFLTIASTLSATYLIWVILQRDGRQTVVKAIILVGTAVALIALYYYVASILGLPVPPRTRLGTSGVGPQATTFTYAFERALGTFREPSILAAWLIVPLFLSLRATKRIINIPTVVIGAALLLTGSLSGIVAAAVGFVVALIVTSSGRGRLPALVKVTLTISVGLAIFSAVAVSNTRGQADLFAVIGERATQILSGGVQQSDRSSIADYVAHTPVPLLGAGLGNANIALSAYFHSAVLDSFISLYLNTLYALGPIGVLLLALFLLSPVARLLRSRSARRDDRLLFVFAAYVAWLVLYAGTIEEPSFMFAVVFALLVFDSDMAASEVSVRRMPESMSGGVTT